MAKDGMGADEILDRDEALQVELVANLLEQQFPLVHEGGRIVIERLSGGRARLRMLSNPSQVRPGGTVSGPAMFKLADLAAYVIVLGAKGASAMDSVTTGLTINFLRRPPPVDVIAEARALKIGRRLAVSEITLYSDGSRDAVAHATATYAVITAPKAAG